MRADEDDGKASAARLQTLVQFQSTHAWKCNVEDRAVCVDNVGKIEFGGCKHGHLMPVRPEQDGQSPPDIGVVVDDDQIQDGLRADPLFRSLQVVALSSPFVE